MAKVLITVKAAEGKCVAGHKLGDSFIQENETTIGGFCSAAEIPLNTYTSRNFLKHRF